MKMIPQSLEEAIEGLRKNLRERNGIEYSFVKSADLFAKYNKDTIFRVTKKLRLPI